MPPQSKLGRGKPLKSQTKEVLHKIYKYFESEIERDPKSTVTAAQLVVHSTGISMNALKRVLTEYKTNVTVKKEYNRTRRRCKKNMISNEYDAQAIRRTIHSFYTRNEEFPIMKDLFLILKADIDYQGSLCTLRRNIAKLGFRWVETEDNNTVLVEKQDIRYQRLQFLTKIDNYKSQDRHIVYTSEIAIESNRMSSKPKPDGSSTVLKQPAKIKLVLLLAGDLDKIYNNTLFIYDGNKRDFKEEPETRKESYEFYEKWYKYYLLSNLKPNSVVVIDSTVPFHTRISNPTPHSNSRKREIMDWLSARGIPFSLDMYKPQLYQLVLLNKDKFMDFKTDAYLREHGHTVLRIPQHHPDLNPVKNILVSVRDYIGKNGCLSQEAVLKIASEKLSSFSKKEWEQACHHSESEENVLRSTERVIDDITERTFKNIDDQSSESEMEEDNGTDQESMDSD